MSVQRVLQKQLNKKGGFSRLFSVFFWGACLRSGESSPVSVGCMLTLCLPVAAGPPRPVRLCRFGLGVARHCSLRTPDRPTASERRTKETISYPSVQNGRSLAPLCIFGRAVCPARTARRRPPSARARCNRCKRGVLGRSPEREGSR